MSKWPGDSQSEKTTFGDLRRGELMARIKSKGNQTTEQRLAQLLNESGIDGWELHEDLPGKPDFTWRDKMLTVFVDGCFWHGHNCGRNLTPKTNADVWQRKFEKTRLRDQYVNETLQQQGWRVIRIWECELKAHPNESISRIQQGLDSRISSL